MASTRAGLSMESVLFGILVIAVTTAFSVGGFLAFRKLIKADYLNRHHDIADPMLSLLGTLYSVLLGFLVAGAVAQFDEARTTVHAEANALADIYRLSYGIKDDSKEKIRELCREYCSIMVTEEWDHMDKQKQLSAAGWETYEKICQSCLKINASNPGVSNIHAAMLQAVAAAGANRRERAIAVSRNLSPSIWLVTVFGSVIIIIFTYLFSAEKTALQCWMIAMVAASLALNVFLLVIFSQPFNGIMRIPADAFRLNLELFDRHTNIERTSL